MKSTTVGDRADREREADGGDQKGALTLPMSGTDRCIVEKI